MTINPKDLKPSAIVTARMRVTDETIDASASCGVYASPIHVSGNIWIPLADILSIEPRPIAVGDRVTVGSIGIGERECARVRYIEGDEAVVYWDCGTGLGVLRLSDLTHADEVTG